MGPFANDAQRPTISDQNPCRGLMGFSFVGLAHRDPDVLDKKLFRQIWALFSGQA